MLCYGVGSTPTGHVRIDGRHLLFFHSLLDRYLELSIRYSMGRLPAGVFEGRYFLKQQHCFQVFNFLPGLLWMYTGHLKEKCGYLYGSVRISHVTGGFDSPQTNIKPHKPSFRSRSERRANEAEGKIQLIFGYREPRICREDDSILIVGLKMEEKSLCQVVNRYSVERCTWYTTACW